MPNGATAGVASLVNTVKHQHMESLRKHKCIAKLGCVWGVGINLRSSPFPSSPLPFFHDQPSLPLRGIPGHTLMKEYTPSPGDSAILSPRCFCEYECGV